MQKPIRSTRSIAQRTTASCEAVGRRSLKRRSLNLGLAVPALLALALVSGCSSLSEHIQGPEVVHNYQPSDLPVPLKFDMSEDPYENWAVIDFIGDPLNLRIGRFTYYGNRPLLELSHWFLEQMPIEGWTHVKTSNRGDITMQFEKQDEAAEITVERVVDKNGEFYLTKLTANLRPRVQNN